MNDIELLRQMYLDNLSKSTAEVLMLWADEIRTQEVERARGILNLQKGALLQNEQAYRYALGKYRISVEGQRIFTQTYRLTEREIGLFAEEHGLDAHKLIAVAIGDREQYQGYIQGPMIRFTYGKKYVKPDTDKHPDEDKPVPEKVGVRGLFGLGMRRDRTFEDDE